MSSTTQRIGTGGGRWGMRADVLRHGDGHDGSRVGYIELFFDLVFVFAVTQLSHSLIAHPDLTTLLHTLILGWAVWWLWIDTTWVTNWLDPEKVPVRTMLLVLMLLGLLMSSAIPEAFEGKALLFAVPFVLIQVGRTLFTVWAMGRHWPENAENFVRITVWLGVSGAFWIAGAMTHDERTRLVLWVVAALIDVVGPRALFWVPGMGPTNPHTWSVRGSHMAERVSLFLIISLGESIIVTGTAFAELELDATTLLAFLAAFASTVLMWLLFFDRSEQSATAYFSSQTTRGWSRRPPTPTSRSCSSRASCSPRWPTSWSSCTPSGTPARGPRRSSAEPPRCTCWATRSSGGRRRPVVGGAPRRRRRGAGGVPAA